MRINFARLKRHEISQNIVASVMQNRAANAENVYQGNNFEEKIQQQHMPIVSFTINYPFSINRSVSQSSMKKQLAYLQAKKQLPASTLKFIKKSLDSEFQKQASTKNIEEKIQINTQKQLKAQDQSENIEKKQLNTIYLIDKNSNAKNHAYLTKKLNRKQIKQKMDQKLYEIRKPCVRAQKYRKKQKQLDGVTHKPLLNYTMNSKATKMIKNKRNNHFKTCQMDVFDSLYYDASIYASKRQLQRVIREQEQKNITVKTSRVRVNTTFEQRLRLSIQKQAARKKMAQQKLKLDETGRRYFIPNISQSKNSFNLNYTSRTIAIQLPEQSIYPARAGHYSKDSQKFNYSQQMTSTLNNSNQNELNKSLNAKYQITIKPLQKQIKLANYYSEILWSQKGLRDQRLNGQEKKILQKIFKKIRHYQQKYSKNVNKQAFTTVFKDFYNVLNFYDRSILYLKLKKQRQAEKQLERHQKNKTKLIKSRYRSNSNITLYHNKSQFFI